MHCISNCAESVVYSGGFHTRPEGGWENLNFSDYTDDSVAQLLELNFTGINVVALAQDDPSRNGCREYGLGVHTMSLEGYRIAF
ncbi:hypothetical protein EV702DRAFT_1095730 [Suillus placidus]|uniref:Uncharacterized protein n=1 Tax=Suillus placidus TaxID=48579 RepID=A0A9P7D420_9AGAM|nr:hypothetical protein EV702DRAFT_1095730 [Suillus placidus]